jgi:hypothetical protein
MELWFASNARDTSKGCHRDDSSGCELWVADLIVTEHAVRVISAVRPEGLPDTPSWFPSVKDIGGATLVAFNATEPLPGSIRARNSVVMAEMVPPHDRARNVEEVQGFRFPNLDRSRNQLVATEYEAAFGVGKVSNVKRAPYSGTVIGSWELVSRFGPMGRDSAEDGAIIPRSGSSVVYQDRSASAAFSLIANNTPAGWVRASGSPDEECGHMAPNADGTAVACDVAREVQIRSYTVVRDWGSRPIPGRTQFGAAGVYLTPEDQSSYPNSDRCVGDSTLMNTYSSWGDSSTLLLFSSMCAQGEPQRTTSSTLLLAWTSPDTGPAALVDLGSAIGEFMGVEHADYCTGDFTVRDRPWPF